MLKKFLKFFFAGCFVLAVIFLGLAVVVLLAIKDEPRHDVSDLLAQKAFFPEGQDALPLLFQAEQALQERKLLSQAIRQIVHQEEWDSALAKNALAPNQAALQLLEQANQKQGVNLPQDLLANKEGIEKLKSLWGLLALQVLALHREGKQAEALQQALALQKMVLWIDTSSILEHYDPSPENSRSAKALSLLRRLLRSSSLSPEAYAQAANELNRLSPQPTDFETTLRASFRHHLALFDQERAILEDKSRPKTPAKTILLNVPYTFMPNRTIREMAEAHRLLIKQADKLCVDMQFTTPPLYHGPETRLLLEFIFKSNGYGRMFLNAALHGVIWAAENYCATKTQLEGTTLLLGLRCFQAKTGSLPSSLDQLVPECLPALPADSFYGQPWMYDPIAKKIRIAWHPKKNGLMDVSDKEQMLTVDF